jgi:hypothetical protein
MPSKKKSKSKAQHQSIVTPKVSGKLVENEKNVEPDSREQSAEVEVNTGNIEQTEVAGSVEDNAAMVVDSHSEDGAILQDEILISPNAAAEEEPSETASDLEHSNNSDTEMATVEIDIPKKDKKKKNSLKSETVKLVETSYHYFRGWLRGHLKESAIKGFRFVKDDIGWQGFISIPEESYDAGMKALKEFKDGQPEGTKDLFW